MSVMTYLLHLDPDACADVLASATLGRLGVIVDGRPEIFPVNHVYDRQTGCVAFPTNVGTKLRAALDWPWVAFEVDGVEHDGGAGWSVLVVGRAETITDPDAVARAGARPARALGRRGGRDMGPDRSDEGDRAENLRLRERDHHPTWAGSAWRVG